MNLYTSRFGYWRDECAPQSKIQRASHALHDALDCFDQVGAHVPNAVWDLIRRDMQKVREIVDRMDDQLEMVDPLWCDGCSRWTEDAVHKAHCEGEYDEDEYDAIRDALIAGVSYGPVPGPQQGGNDGP